MGTKIIEAIGVSQPYVDVFPKPLLAQRSPVSTDVDYPLGQRWYDQSASPAVEYTHMGGGTWSSGGNAYATTSDPGIVTLSNDIAGDAASLTLVPAVKSIKDYVDAIAPAASESVSGIAELATQAETNTGTDDARIVTPLKLTTFLATPAAIGGTTPAAGSFTTLAAATQFTMTGGAATDFIGQVTLVGGTQTVANTNIAAGDRILLTRSALNASPALGHPITTISAGASFTVTAYDNSGVAVVTDVSTFDYFIVRQT